MENLLQKKHISKAQPSTFSFGHPTLPKTKLLHWFYDTFMNCFLSVFPAEPAARDLGWTSGSGTNHFTLHSTLMAAAVVLLVKLI